MKAAPLGQVVQIPTSKIKPMPGQPRLHFDPVQLARLRESIAEIGQQQPAVVVPWGDGTYRIRDGERRWRACSTLRIPLACIVVPAKSEDEEFELATVANLNRESHSPIEKARAMKRLRDGRLQRTTEQIARTFGVSTQTVYNHLKVLELPSDVLALMDPNKMGGRAKTLQVSAALRLTALADHPRDQLKLAQTIVGKGLGLQQANQIIDRRADQLQVGSGIGRERTPADYIKGVERALRTLDSVVERLLRDQEADWDLFGKRASARQRELVALIGRARKQLEKLEEVAS